MWHQKVCVCLFSRGGSFQLPHSSPLWPLFSHPKSICITASFMSAGQCPIHTAWHRVCVCVCSERVCESLHFIFPLHFFFLALPHLTVFSLFFSFTCVRCCTIEPQSWCLSFVSDYGVLSPSSTNCSGQRTNGPRFDLLQISTLTCISSSRSWFLLVAPCLSPVNISKEECGCQWLEDDPCSSYQVKWFLISVNGSD